MLVVAKYLNPSIMLDVNFPDFMPVSYVETGATIVLLLVLAGLLLKLRRWHRSIPNSLLKDIRRLSFSEIMSVLLTTVFYDGLAVGTLYKNYKGRWSTHLLVFWGFIGLGITTTLAYLFDPSGAPMKFNNPIRILGNISGAMLVIGGTIAAVKFVSCEEERNRLTKYADGSFLALIYMATLTGFATEYLGYGSQTGAADFTYAIHLLFVGGLLALAPFTRFVHALEAPYMALYENYRLLLQKRGIFTSHKDERVAEYALAKFYGEHSKSQ